MTRKNSDIAGVLIAGPTASGKSALALRHAAELGGVVVNADSMQVYRGLEILSAQPSPHEQSRVPHRLYGHVDPAAEYSVGAWMRDIEPLLKDLADEGRPAVIVGGTGLYFRALLGGIDAMPPVPEEIRAHWRGRMAAAGPAALHAELRALDPQAAARIRPGDPQRIVRALELVAATGGPLSAIQRGEGAALVDGGRMRKIVLSPPRAALRERIRLRFATMVENGALAEAERFRTGELVAGGTAAKAIGLAELIEHLEGRSSLETAVEQAVTRTRQYAKRQDTWFRHQLDATWERLVVPEP